jgi:rhodanese-related sulfurtransferase
MLRRFDQRNCKTLNMQQILLYASHHWILVSLTVAAAIVVLVQETRARTANFASIGPMEAVRLINSGGLLIDIRSKEVYDAGHIRNARNLPGAAIVEGAKVIERFKDKPVIAYCDTGMTAGAAARHLGRLGFTQAFNLRGGLAAWRQENLPVDKT